MKTSAEFKDTSFLTQTTSMGKADTQLNRTQPAKQSLPAPKHTQITYLDHIVSSRCGTNHQPVGKIDQRNLDKANFRCKTCSWPRLHGGKTAAKDTTLDLTTNILRNDGC
jgi:hypothetical protein